MSDVVELESIRDCLRAGLPSSMATCSPEGTLHIEYVSRVEYLDRERIATSRQAFNRGASHLGSSPFSQVVVTRPKTAEEFRLDLSYLHTTAEGEEFEAVRANLDAIAAHAGMGPDFRLRGLDVHRVLRVRRVRRERREPPGARIDQSLVRLEQFARRLERTTTHEETTRELIDALHDLFGFGRAVLVV